MPFVSVCGIRMYYEIRGGGPRLLFISGTGGDLRRSPNAFDFPLTSHFEVLAYDQRGLGQAVSARPKSRMCPTPWRITLLMRMACCRQWAGIAAW